MRRRHQGLVDLRGFGVRPPTARILSALCPAHAIHVNPPQAVTEHRTRRWRQRIKAASPRWNGKQDHLFHSAGSAMTRIDADQRATDPWVAGGCPPARGSSPTINNVVSGRPLRSADVPCAVRPCAHGWPGCPLGNGAFEHGFTMALGDRDPIGLRHGVHPGVQAVPTSMAELHTK